MADLLGAGVAKALLGKDVLSDELPFVTGSIGLLGTRPSYEMMSDCDTLLTVGSNFPYTQFMPDLDQAAPSRSTSTAAMIGMRYPYEVNLVGDARSHAARADPDAAAQGGPRAGGTTCEQKVARWWEVMDAEAHGRRRAGQPDADLQRVLASRRRATA